MPRGPLIVVSGPAGVGKSTLVGRLVSEAAWPVRASVSVTTRQPRPGERDGVHYHFWDRERFAKEVQADGFLEWAEVFGNHYGTLRSEVDAYREQGMGVILTIDVQGWEQVRQRCPDVVSIFVRTSSVDTLKKRLEKRGTETPAVKERRLQGALAELARADEYDYQVINDDLEAATTSLRAIVSQLFERSNHA